MENKELITDLVTWVSKQTRPYNEVMEAWRTSCPRLPIWEDATEFGLIERALDDDDAPIVRITERGEAFLAASKSS